MCATSSSSLASRDANAFCASASRRPLRPGSHVVADHELSVGADPADQLVELQRHQPSVGAQLDDIAADLLGDPSDHLHPLHHRCDVSHGD